MSLEKISTGDNLSNQIGRMMMHHVYVPGSISFNNVAFMFMGQASSTRVISMTFSFGLYSLNVSTLSLANSASKSSTFSSTNTVLQMITMITSATQDITPGDWWFGFMSSTSSGTTAGSFGLAVNSPNQPAGSVAYGGPFERGMFTATTAAFPASINTANMSKEATSTSVPSRHPYILISA